MTTQPPSPEPALRPPPTLAEMAGALRQCLAGADVVAADVGMTEEQHNYFDDARALLAAYDALPADAAPSPGLTPAETVAAAMYLAWDGRANPWPWEKLSYGESVRWLKLARVALETIGRSLSPGLPAGSPGRAEIRAEALEEAAKVCEVRAERADSVGNVSYSNGARACAAGIRLRIRALAATPTPGSER